MKLVIHCNVVRCCTKTPAFWICLLLSIGNFFIQLSENKCAGHFIVFIVWCYHGSHFLTGMFFKVVFFFYLIKINCLWQHNVLHRPFNAFLFVLITFKSVVLMVFRELQKSKMADFKMDAIKWYLIIAASYDIQKTKKTKYRSAFYICPLSFIVLIYRAKKVSCDNFMLKPTPFPV